MIALLAILALAVVGALALWRLADRRADDSAVSSLLAAQPRSPPAFDPGMVADLPDPAQRYFLYAIAPGTPLRTVARISMTGRIGLGDRDAPGYRPMRATQIIAAPHGFVWSVTAGAGALRISGSDAALPDDSWSRFRIAGLIPVARGGHTPDHARSSFGRLVAEAAFWTPAALLPGPGVRWSAPSADVARVEVSFGTLQQSADISVGPDGRPEAVRIDRWTDANPDRTFRLQPFGGRLSEFRDFAGFRLPTHVEGGNFFGEECYFPFFIADVQGIIFPP